MRRLSLLFFSLSIRLLFAGSTNWSSTSVRAARKLSMKSWHFYSQHDPSRWIKGIHNDGFPGGFMGMLLEWG